MVDHVLPRQRRGDRAHAETLSRSASPDKEDMSQEAIEDGSYEIDSSHRRRLADSFTVSKETEKPMDEIHNKNTAR